MSPRPRRRTPSAVDMHRAWLQLVDVDGPFLSVPVLRRAYPQGIVTLTSERLGALKPAKDAFERAWDRWSKGVIDVEEYRTARDAWVDHVLHDTFGWGQFLVGTDVEVTSPNRQVTLRASGAFRRNDETCALVLVVDPVRSLRDVSDDGWATDAVDRMELLLREDRVPVGVVTDGRWWGIVSAPPGVTAASGITDSQTWVEEPGVRDAFAELLSPLRLANRDPKNRLSAMFADSVTAAEDITIALGSQVRRAVELLIRAFSETAEEALRRGEPNPLPDDGDEIYAAAVTVMMRVVFLLFAEERDLLPQGELFDSGYGLTGQLSALQARAEVETHEGLDATSATWHRLLATSHALFQGASFEDMRLPAYGGSLFTPDRFGFLTALNDRGTLALPVNDRVMMHVLDAVQMADVKGEGRRPISFRDIDVEQIGYIYEGLLGYTCRHAERTVLGLIGKPGEEPEIPLHMLEDLDAQHPDPKRLAQKVIDWAKEDQPSATPPTTASLAKAITNPDAVEDAELAIRAITADPVLAERLRPWIGIIRRDLRDRPTVFKAGGLLVVETPSRRNAGAHYTPRALAEEVVQHALEPIVYSPGPYQTPDRDAWRLKSPEEILDLKVADIACGSGAFLVAAARYLGARLVEAWRESGTAVGSPDGQERDAIRQVVARCLYGADINPMAIEMCKLSLWLVSLDPRLPFSFVDDKMLVGNSLLGITDLTQLQQLHIHPDPNPNIGLFDASSTGEITVDLHQTISRAIKLRQTLASEVDDNDSQRSAHAKQLQLRRFNETTAQLRHIADGVIATGLRLGGKPGRNLNDAYDNLRIAVNDAYPSHGAVDASMLEAIINAGLRPTVDTDYERWQPIHWAIELPDVMQRGPYADGGFDAIIGNPPFLGGKKISPAMGSNLREWFVNTIAGGTKGNADLVAYFLLRAHSLINREGMLGLIATNTVAQGDTREVGLDQMVTQNFTITRSIQSRKWPATTANLEYAAVWGSRGQVAPDSERIADGLPAHRISTLLEPDSGTSRLPQPLHEAKGIAFKGVNINGLGFLMSPTDARQLISKNPHNSHVLKPYYVGKDLNQSPEGSTGRWIADFGTMDYTQASAFPDALHWVQERVPEQRAHLDSKPRLKEQWWRFEAPAITLRGAVSALEQVLAIAVVSQTLMPIRLNASFVFSQDAVVFATDSYAQQAILSSSLHQLWAIKYGSGMRNDPRYTPSDVFETFPRPAETPELEELGQTLDRERREMMLRRDLGLTKLYNLVNDESATSDPDVLRLREIHVALDEAVMRAYGWDDVPLDHGFHTYRKMTRWTVSPTARVEILDRLLEENHRRAANAG